MLLLPLLSQHLYRPFHQSNRIPETAVACGTTKPTVKRAIDDLLRLGIVAEIAGKPRNKVYIYREYLDILNQDDDISKLSNDRNNPLTNKEA